MQVIRKKSELISVAKQLKLDGKTIGLVPTMGALHDGHKSLFIRARQENDIFISSVFVNPIQFNNKEDFDKYPRTEVADLQILESTGCDIAFVPTYEQVYGDEQIETFTFGQLEQVMEGVQRPGHFSGVANIVSRLFEWSMADNAYFGEKDYQQIAIIKDMVRQKGYKINILPCPIYRDADGLATSSRNMRLSSEARAIAPKIHQILLASYRQKDVLSISQIKAFVEDEINNVKAFELEYFAMVDDTTLQPVKQRKEHQGIVGCIAVWLDGVRLIDIQRYW